MAETVGGAINWRAAKSYFDWRSIEAHERPAIAEAGFPADADLCRSGDKIANDRPRIDDIRMAPRICRWLVETGAAAQSYRILHLRLREQQKSMGGYVGATPFAVVMQNNQAVFVDIGRGKDFDFITIQCNKAFQTLPPAPAEMFDSPKAEAGAGSSLADELSRLASLRDTGALTEAEFVAAKTKLLQK